jgi:hypothetical protein
MKTFLDSATLSGSRTASLAPAYFGSSRAEILPPPALIESGQAALWSRSQASSVAFFSDQPDIVLDSAAQNSGQWIRWATS